MVRGEGSAGDVHTAVGEEMLFADLWRLPSGVDEGGPDETAADFLFGRVPLAHDSLHTSHTEPTATDQHYLYPIVDF